jgi:hypothetical protein
VDIGTVIAYKEGVRPWGQFETRRKIMASKKAAKKLKKGAKIQPKKALSVYSGPGVSEIVITK